MHKIKINLLIIFILTLVNGQEIESGLKEGKSTAAVLDFEGSGITIQEAQVLTQRLGSELVQTKALIMVERNQMSEIMEEQGIQQSGCTSQECAAEIGNILGVQKMITGSYVEFCERKILPQFKHLSRQKINREHRRDGFETGNADKIFESTYLNQTKKRD